MIRTTTRALIGAETGVVYTEKQWMVIQRIREYLQDPEPDEAEDPKKQDYKVTNTLMYLCMLVVMQDTSRIGLYDSPLMHYLAVRGVDEQSKTFRGSFFYTPILAAALWINWLIMLEVAVPLEAWPALRLESKAQVESVRERIHELRRRHLCEGSFSPTASILSQLAMGKHLNKLHQSQPNINWSEDEQTIYYLGEGVELGKIRDMCRTLIQELQEALEELTFGSVPGIDLGTIVDSMAWAQAFRRESFSFIKHAANKEHTGVGYGYLLERARKGEGRWRLLRKSQAGQTEWVDVQVKKYLSKERQFLRKLMVCMYVTGKYLSRESIPGHTGRSMAGWTIPLDGNFGNRGALVMWRSLYLF